MFRGSFEHTTDDKGRVSIPAKFREILLGVQDDRLVVTKFILGSFRCLDVYPYAEWERLEQVLRKKPRFDPDILKLQHYYVSSAQECSVDRQGRILLPPVLREYAGITKDVVFAAALEMFRIWHRGTWEQFNAEAENDLASDPKLFNGLNEQMTV